MLKKKTLIKTKRNQTKKMPHTVLERRTLCFSWYKNHNLKAKLWRARARERKKRAFFVPFILSEGNFFNICVLSQCIVYWIHFQNKHTFTCQKKLLQTLSCLFLKSSKAFSVSLKISQNSQENTSVSLLFNTVAAWRSTTSIKKRVHPQCFPVKFEKF